MTSLRRLAAGSLTSIALTVSGLAVAAPSYADGTSTTPTTDQIAQIQLQDPQLQADLDQIVAELPQHADPTAAGQQLEALSNQGELSGVDDAAVSQSQSACSSTPLFNWIVGKLGSDTNLWGALSQLGLTDAPLYYSLKFENNPNAQYYGLNGEYTTEMNHEFRVLKGFWDINSNPIQMVGMHSAFLDDTSKLVPFLQWYWGVDAATATELAPQVKQLVDAVPQGTSNPYWTFNSFAYAGGGSDPTSPFDGVPPKIMVGDGIPEGLQASGIDPDLGNEAVLGHEYGHQVQYADNLQYPETDAAGASMHRELQADAFGTYFMVNSHGESANKATVLNTEHTFYQVGDCGTTDPSHHGTPDQRMASSTWAADLASQARPQGTVLPAQTFVNDFEQEYPTILATN